MKIKEFISALSEFDENLEIYVNDNDFNLYHILDIEMAEADNEKFAVINIEIKE